MDCAIRTDCVVRMDRAVGADCAIWAGCEAAITHAVNVRAADAIALCKAAAQTITTFAAAPAVIALAATAAAMHATIAKNFTAEEIAVEYLVIKSIATGEGGTAK
jgi:hypothetical protein